MPQPKSDLQLSASPCHPLSQAAIAKEDYARIKGLFGGDWRNAAAAILEARPGTNEASDNFFSTLRDATANYPKLQERIDALLTSPRLVTTDAVQVPIVHLHAAPSLRLCGHLVTG